MVFVATSGATANSSITISSNVARRGGYR
jgi:hypothetical protein